MTSRAPKPSKTLMFRLYDNRKNHNLILNWLLNELPQTNRGTDICYTLENILLAHIKKTCTEEEVKRFKETPAPLHPKSRQLRSDEGNSPYNQPMQQTRPTQVMQTVQKTVREDDFGDFDQKPPILSRGSDTLSEGGNKSGRMGKFVKNANFDD